MNEGEGLTQRRHLTILTLLLVGYLVIGPTLHGCMMAAESNFTSQDGATSLNSYEQQVVALVNGTRIYDDDLQLEMIASGHLAYRSAGSLGANETANWIKQEFDTLGLQASLEPFQFWNWTLMSKASLIIDEDGNKSTTEDQTTIHSVQSEHYSWPTPPSGAFADLVVLPLPLASSRSEIGTNQINMTAWDAINTTGKITLVGKEVRWDTNWYQTYLNKLTNQPPAAVVFTWWYDWMSFAPPFFSSSGGLPLIDLTYWNLHIPVCFVSHDDGVTIVQQEHDHNVSAQLTLNSTIGTGTHYNVVAKITGHDDPQRFVIISAHYDTVMCNGFCDNGAGVAGVIETARVLSDAINKGLYTPIYTLIFAAFTGEELEFVGSAHYVQQHKSEMPKIVAVVNLDCIGSSFLNVTETVPGNGLDLDEVCVKAAQDLGVSCSREPPGGSDQEAFRTPYAVDGWIQRDWGQDLGISDAIAVDSSIGIDSYPLLYSNKWDMGAPGWIHTPYDNSTSTQTLGWVQEDKLESHTKVVVLSTMRIVAITAVGTGTDFTPVIIGSVVAVAVVVPFSVYLAMRKSWSKKEKDIDEARASSS